MLGNLGSDVYKAHAALDSFEVPRDDSLHVFSLTERVNLLGHQLLKSSGKVEYIPTTSDLEGRVKNLEAKVKNLEWLAMVKEK